MFSRGELRILARVDGGSGWPSLGGSIAVNTAVIPNHHKQIFFEVREKARLIMFSRGYLRIIARRGFEEDLLARFYKERIGERTTR